MPRTDSSAVAQIDRPAAGDEGQEGEFAYLLIESPNREPVRKNIARTTTLVGSAKLCNIQLLSSSISPVHCVITRDDDALCVRDLRSAAGTKLNGELVEVHRLRDGDRLELGPFVFNVRTNFDSRPPATAAEQLSEAEDERFASAHDDVAPLAELADTFVLLGLLPRSRADALVEADEYDFKIGPYQALKLLGSGGMGWLYLARDVDADRQLALKVYAERGDADPGLLTRLQLEARAGMQLDHPHIVKMFKIDKTQGIFGDVHYVVMEYVPGVNLQELVSSTGVVPVPQACDMFRQAAAGLHYAHESGMVHRDVKPENLLVDASGEVKLLDFGLALVDKDDEFSLSMIFGQDCLGTADYIAPEQTRDSHDVDRRADIYSLGCTLYAALSGRIPFRESDAAKKVDAHRNKQPRPLKKMAPRVPDEVVAVVEKMMAKSPDDRFQTAEEVCQALEPFAERRPVDFDFDAVLRNRSNAARRRIAATERSRGLSSHTVLVSPSQTKLRPASGANELAGDAPGSDTLLTSDPEDAPGGRARVEMDPDLAELSDAWGQLPDYVKKTILQMAKAMYVRKNGE